MTRATTTITRSLLNHPAPVGILTNPTGAAHDGGPRPQCACGRDYTILGGRGENACRCAPCSLQKARGLPYGHDWRVLTMEQRAAIASSLSVRPVVPSSPHHVTVSADTARRPQPLLGTTTPRVATTPAMASSQPRPPLVTVRCAACRWRSHRVARPDGAFGDCPHCGAPVTPIVRAYTRATRRRPTVRLVCPVCRWGTDRVRSTGTTDTLCTACGATLRERTRTTSQAARKEKTTRTADVQESAA